MEAPRLPAGSCARASNYKTATTGGGKRGPPSENPSRSLAHLLKPVLYRSYCKPLSAMFVLYRCRYAAFPETFSKPEPSNDTVYAGASASDFLLGETKDSKTLSCSGSELCKQVFRVWTAVAENEIPTSSISLGQHAFLNHRRTK